MKLLCFQLNVANATLFSFRNVILPIRLIEADSVDVDVAVVEVVEDVDRHNLQAVLEVHAKTTGFHVLVDVGP